MTTPEVILILGLLWSGIALVVVLLTAIVVLKALRTLPPEQTSRPIPPIVSQLRRRARSAPQPVATVHTDQSQEPLQGVNAWPEPEVQEGEDVDDLVRVEQIAGVAERQMELDREKWWDEMREEGFTDEEIEEKEASMTVQVFD